MCGNILNAMSFQINAGQFYNTCICIVYMHIHIYTHVQTQGVPFNLCDKIYIIFRIKRKQRKSVSSLLSHITIL